MQKNLAIHVRFHEGRYHGAGKWPPDPARLFQAFVAAAATGRKISNKDRQALLWLEGQNAPTILAPSAKPQKTLISYLPNNDDVVGLDRPREPVEKSVKPWLFNPDIPITYLWEKTEDMEMMDRMKLIANRLYQLGRGVDFAWADTQTLTEEDTAAMISSHSGRVYHPMGQGEGGYAAPKAGSLDSLQFRYEASLNRLQSLPEQKSVFVVPPEPRFAQVRYNTSSKYLRYEIRRIQENRLQAFPSAQAGLLVQQLIRNVAKKLSESLPDKKEMIDKFLIGRNADRFDTLRRVRVFAIPTLRPQGDRAIRRIAVEIPVNCPLRADDLEWAFTGISISPFVEDGTLDETKDTLPVLVPAENSGMFERYNATAWTWHSETPVALPIRHRQISLDKSRNERKTGNQRVLEQNIACSAVFSALRHANIDIKPNVVSVQREPYTAQGTRAEAFAHGTRFPKHVLWHVELTFPTSIPGPLILGDGRFQGFGLMVPDKRVRDVHAFSICNGLRDKNPSVLTHALRRAVMARVQDRIGRGPLSPLFTGHQMDGKPLRSGRHTHLAFAVDLPRQRLLIIAPHVLEHRKLNTDRDKKELELLEGALAEFRELRAGCAGRLKLARSQISAEDPLFCRTCIWESLTPYSPTRHPKRETPEVAVKEDILVEIDRCGLPKPRKIDLLGVDRGPRGGLEAHARLVFSSAVKGPILLGRTMHFGGGLFTSVG